VNAIRCTTTDSEKGIMLCESRDFGKRPVKGMSSILVFTYKALIFLSLIWNYIARMHSLNMRALTYTPRTFDEHSPACAQKGA